MLLYASINKTDTLDDILIRVISLEKDDIYPVNDLILCLFGGFDIFEYFRNLFKSFIPKIRSLDLLIR